MKRSYELLIAEHLKKGGFITNIDQAINHMSRSKGYTSTIYKRNDKESWTVVTVVFAHYTVVIYYIDNNTEEVFLLGKLGF